MAPAFSPAIAAAPDSAAARRAASALLATAMRGTPGRCCASHCTHCASDCPCEYTRVTAPMLPAFDSRFWLTRSLTSPQIESSVATMRSMRAADGAFGRILDRHHGVVRLAAVDRAEDVVERRRRHRLDERAEVLGDRGVAERAGGPEVGDAQRLLERAARRHDLAEHAGDGSLRQRPGVRRVQAREHLRLALGAVRRAPALQLADRLRVPRALVQALEDLAIQRVDGALSRAMRQQTAAIVGTSVRDGPGLLTASQSEPYRSAAQSFGDAPSGPSLDLRSRAPHSFVICPSRPRARGPRASRRRRD